MFFLIIISLCFTATIWTLVSYRKIFFRFTRTKTEKEAAADFRSILKRLESAKSWQEAKSAQDACFAFIHFWRQREVDSLLLNTWAASLLSAAREKLSILELKASVN